MRYGYVELIETPPAHGKHHCTGLPISPPHHESLGGEEGGIGETNIGGDLLGGREEGVEVMG
ncbi:hypothetical protein EON65_19865 [archaeon]|nr:MAG: hypothetical protein EON65_19865 [archaeon]